MEQPSESSQTEHQSLDDLQFIIRGARAYAKATGVAPEQNSMYQLYVQRLEEERLRLLAIVFHFDNIFLAGLSADVLWPLTQGISIESEQVAINLAEYRYPVVLQCRTCLPCLQYAFESPGPFDANFLNSCLPTGCQHCIDNGLGCVEIHRDTDKDRLLNLLTACQSDLEGQLRDVQIARQTRRDLIRWVYIEHRKAAWAELRLHRPPHAAPIDTVAHPGSSVQDLIEEEKMRCLGPSSLHGSDDEV
ncbi:hypothetical protein N7490_005196 [Penicillium lividum]|nr:hypothetical protein N7490_005196 [Penicillium lividum]